MKKTKKANDLIDEAGIVHRAGPSLAEINDIFPSDHELSLREAAINPGHYKEIVPGFEYFDIMDHVLKGWSGSQAASLANAYKYMFRLGKKDSVLQDLGKALWYLERLQKNIEDNGKR
jgi:hypothetical protein